MADPGSIEQFYDDLREEVNAEASVDIGGCSKEQMFTRLVLRRLEDAGETEDARECRDVLENRKGQSLHQVNGYALSEGLETLELFVTLYGGTESVPRIDKQRLATAAAQAHRFVDRAIKGYVDEIEPSAPIFDLALTIKKEWRQLIRVNIYVLTDGIVVARDLPELQELRGGIQVRLEVRDLAYLHRLAAAEGGRLPIEIDFASEGSPGLPCLPFGGGSRYRSYLAIVPGDTLAGIYQEHGSRLLEQNVRSFLQFTGKINKGIRETIQNEPSMFFAYNNGIAATAESVVIGQDSQGRDVITRVRDFQIVNGGQTTASIFHTMRQHKADLTDVAVQVKLTIINEPERFTDVVSRIARFANSQNRITEADLSSNSPYNIELERLSRVIWAPPRDGQTYQTHWFFERTRGQYKNALNRDGYTPARRKAFSRQNPLQQKFDKEEIARFTFSAAGKPWHVVRGRQKAYAEFVRGLKKSALPNRQDFEDLVARAILFKTAERLYGTKRQAHVIGDLRYITVPYALSWLMEAIEREGERLDLWKVWRTQSVSPVLSDAIRSVLVQTDGLIRSMAPGGLIGEWAKKEDAWEALRTLTPSLDLAALRDDLESPNRHRPTYGQEDLEGLEAEAQEARVHAIPVPVWERLLEWATPLFPRREGAPDLLFTVVQRVRSHAKLSPAERRHAMAVLDRAIEEASELLADMDDIAKGLSDPAPSASPELTVEDARAIFCWEQKNFRLKSYDVEFLKMIRDGRRSLTSRANMNRLVSIQDKAISYGYEGLDAEQVGSRSA